ncbi:hypothetical protein NWF34_13115 [Gordonia sp. GONU]|nr:hypothetical protein [Gordonia sp. GONU]
MTGGFLSGLDVSLSRGLNVVIGPRGSGKTTFLELLRHAVGAQHAEQSPQLARQRKAFLDAVLGAGDVVVDIESDDGGRHLVVDAQGAGQRPDLSSSVLVLGQNELEEIASDAPSRLKLLDLRAAANVSVPSRDDAATMTSDIYDIRSELEDRREEAKKRVRLLADRELLASQEKSLLGDSAGRLTDQRSALHQAEDRVLSTGRTLERIKEVQKELGDILRLHAGQTERLSTAAEMSAKFLDRESVSIAFTQAIRSARQLENDLNIAQDALSSSQIVTQDENEAARAMAAPIREQLEQAEAGLGQITAQLRNIDAELKALEDNDEALDALEIRLRDLLRKRADELDKVERTEEEFYRARFEIASLTTKQIASNVVVVVNHLADSAEFAEFLQRELKGTSTRARASLIDSVCESVLPRQLLEMVENNDVATFSAITGISVDRAQKLLDNLNKKPILKGLTQINLSDEVDFRLRDGAVDKSVDELSTGQKCAVTLPIVLSERERTLILDQPEDHLDNAFLVANIVTGLRTRSKQGAQTIVATHNANIPVLGSADNVIVLTSDGKNGSVEAQEQFDDEQIVDSITRLMEGGRDAFSRRSAFYSQYGTV